MANLLFVIAPKGFRDEEYFIPKQILEENDYTTQTASTIVGELEGVGGGVASVGMHINEVNTEDFDGVIFVGGDGMNELVDDAEMKLLAKNFYESGKLTAAICVAPAILANADIARGKKLTSWAGVNKTLEAAGAIVTSNKVEIDGNLITADGPNSAKLFAQKIVEYLEKK